MVPKRASEGNGFSKLRVKRSSPQPPLLWASWAAAWKAASPLEQEREGPGRMSQKKKWGGIL